MCASEADGYWVGVVLYRIGNHDIAVMINDLMQSNQNGPPWTPVWQLCEYLP